MKKLIDLTQQKFGRLTVIAYAGRINKITRWQCQCECGKQIIVTACHLRSGESKSCGCFAKEQASKSHTIHGMAADRKTKKNKRLYTIWASMIQRCTNLKNKRWESYGERGINVCEEWRNFIPFRDWALANGYDDDLTIDRIDNDRNYCPNNCRWATWKEQANNKRNTRRTA
jgi:hypothetical protein